MNGIIDERRIDVGRSVRRVGLITVAAATAGKQGDSARRRQSGKFYSLFLHIIL